MAYDNWDWHAGGEFPEDLAPEAGATHIGMFVAWAYSAGLIGEFHLEESAEGLEELKNRTASPGQWLLTWCDGKFWDEDLSEEGNEFARHYYQGDAQPDYITDYDATLGVGAGGPETSYHVPDTWETFDVLKPVLDKRLDEWRSSQS